MSFRVSGKNMDVGDSLREEIETRIANAVDKYYGGGYSGHVNLTKEAGIFEAECLVHLNTGAHLIASGKAQDPRVSFDQAADRIEKRLRRYKRKLKDHNHKSPKDNTISVANYILAFPKNNGELAEDFNPVIIAETTSALTTLTVAGAVMEMDLTEAPLLVFKNAGHGGINVVYKRNDGNIGWIDPSLEAE